MTTLSRCEQLFYIAIQVPIAICRYHLKKLSLRVHSKMNYHFIYVYIGISYIHRYTYIGYSYVPWNPEIWHVEWLCTEITKFRVDSFNWHFSKLMFSSLLWEISLHEETSSVILNKHFKYQVRLLNLWMSKERAPTDTVRTGSGFVPNGLFWTPIYGRIQVLWSCNSKIQ